MAGLLGRGHLENIDFDFFTTVEIGDNSISELGEGAGANVTTDVVFVFVHEEENVGAINILVEGDVNVGEIGGIISFFGDRGRKINDFVTPALKVAAPVSGTFLKFGVTSDNEFFHRLI